MFDTSFSLDLTQPTGLLGLLAVPVLAYYFRHSLSDFPRRQRLWSLACRTVIVLLLVLALAGLTLHAPTREPFIVFAIDHSRSIDPEERAAAASFVDHLVLLTDGNETAGDALAAARRAGVPVWTVPLKARGDPDVQVSAVHTPAQVREGEPFEVEVVLDANHDDEGILELYCGQHKIAERPCKVGRGERREKFTHTLLATPTRTSRVWRRTWPRRGSRSRRWASAPTPTRISSGIWRRPARGASTSPTTRPRCRRSSPRRR